MNSCFNLRHPRNEFFHCAAISRKNRWASLSSALHFFCVSTSAWIPILILYQFSQVWNHYMKCHAIESTRLMIFLSHQDHLDHIFSWCKPAKQHWHRWKDAKFTPVKNLALFSLAWSTALAIVPQRRLNTQDLMRVRLFYRHLSFQKGKLGIPFLSFLSKLWESLRPLKYNNSTSTAAQVLTNCCRDSPAFSWTSSLQASSILPWLPQSAAISKLLP